MNQINDTKRASMLARIRALMAKTTLNGCTEAEAKEAARKVDELMAAYQIDFDEISVRQQEIIQVSVPGAKHAVAYAAGHIAKFTDCRNWRVGNDIVFHGFKVDTEIAEYLALMFRRAIDRESSAATLFNADYDAANASGKAEMVWSFGVGMATRLGERLGQLKSSRDFNHRETTGRDLVMMKKPAVDEAFNKLGLIFGRGSVRTVKDYASFERGQSAAAHVSINQGVTDRAQRQAGRIV